MKKILFSIILLLSVFNVWSAAYSTTNNASGLFSTSTNWIGGIVPGGGDSWIIKPGTTIEFDLTNETVTGFGICTNNGTLSMTQSCYFKMGNQLQGTGQWFIGSAAVPIISLPNRIDRVVIEGTNAGYCAMAGTNNIKFYGDTNIFFQILSNYVAIGDTNLYFTNNVVGVTSNDVIYVSNPAVAGRSGGLHLVYQVNTNCISILGNFTGLNPIHTNNWPGETFLTNIQTNIRTNAAVWKMSRPVAVIQRSKISYTGLFAAAGPCKSNTISGVRATYLGYPLVDNGQNIGWSFYSCTGNSCVSGSICGDGSFNFLTNCFTYNVPMILNCTSNLLVGCVGACSSPGIINAGTNHTIVDSVTYNTDQGGIVGGPGWGHIITNCSANSFAYGGISIDGSGYYIYSCRAFYGNGGMTYRGFSHLVLNCFANRCNISTAGSGITLISNIVAESGISTAGGVGFNIVSCLAMNCTVGGGIMNGGIGSVINSCIASNCAYGGLIRDCRNTIIRDSAISYTNINGGQHIYSSYGIISTARTNSYLVSGEVVNSYNNLSSVNVNWTNFYTPSGSAIVGSDRVITFYASNSFTFPANTVSHMVAYSPISYKTTINPIISLFLTNGISYNIIVDKSMVPSVLSTDLIYTNNTGWTNISFKLTNNYTSADYTYIYVICHADKPNTNGMAKITIPTEYTVLRMP